jgi:hypothetical protein
VQDDRNTFFRWRRQALAEIRLNEVAYANRTVVEESSLSPLCRTLSNTINTDGIKARTRLLSATVLSCLWLLKKVRMVDLRTSHKIMARGLLACPLAACFSGCGEERVFPYRTDALLAVDPGQITHRAMASWPVPVLAPAFFGAEKGRIWGGEGSYLLFGR